MPWKAKSHHNILFSDCSFGVDPYNIILDNVDCSTSSYLVILQCSFSTSIHSNCISGRDDASVTCCESEKWLELESE